MIDVDQPNFLTNFIPFFVSRFLLLTTNLVSPKFRYYIPDWHNIKIVGVNCNVPIMSTYSDIKFLTGFTLGFKLYKKKMFPVYDVYNRFFCWEFYLFLFYYQFFIGTHRRRSLFCVCTRTLPIVIYYLCCCCC